MVAAVRASIFAYGDILLCSFMPDWGVQAIVSWLLSNSFHDENISIVAEEDDETLSSSNGAALLESVVVAVNGCLVEAPKYGLRSPEKELGAHDVFKPYGNAALPEVRKEDFGCLILSMAPLVLFEGINMLLL